MAAAAQVQAPAQPEGHKRKPLAFATQGVTGVIGLYAEASAYRKAKKAANALKPDFDDSEQDIPAYSEELDSSLPAYNDLPGVEFNVQPLPKPVIIPQRRPKDAQRGFMRAYAPDLQTYKGIDEATFLKFLKDFHKESQASKALKVMNATGIAVGAVQNPIAIAASFTIVTAAQTSIQFQTRYRANVFLNKMNEELFHPKNLHVSIMTFRPGVKSGEVDVDVEAKASDESLDKQITRQETLSGMEKLSVQTTGRMAKFRTSDGYTDSEQALPESADLIFPEDNYLKYTSTNGSASSLSLQSTTSSSNPDGKKRSSMTRSHKFISGYYDRRAQAAFAGEHGENARLAVPGASDATKFTSKYSDPNHPVNSGSFSALVSGGKHQGARSLLHIGHSKKHNNNNTDTTAVEDVPAISVNDIDPVTEQPLIKTEAGDLLDPITEQPITQKKETDVEVASISSRRSTGSGDSGSSGDLSKKKSKGDNKFMRQARATMSWDALYLLITEWSPEAAAVQAEVENKNEKV